MMPFDNTATPAGPADRLWTVKEAARFLAVSDSWVYQAARTGALPCIHIGKAVRFDPTALRAYVRGETGGKVVQLPKCR